MSKNLIEDYLSKIKGRIDDLERISTELDSSVDHIINLGKIRQKKIEVASALGNDVVDISSSRYIRDENRIIISAPEIIIGDLDKNGNLISSSGNSKVTIRSNHVNLEGVGKDDSTMGDVTTRASKIHHIAVDPGIDGMENYVGSTSEILSIARGIELRNEISKYRVSRNIQENVPKGIHLLSPTDINLSSLASSEGRKAQLSARQKVIKDKITELTTVLDNMKPSIDSIMNKIEELGKDEIYNVNTLTMPFSYTKIDAANRRLESYLIAMLKHFDKFFKLHSQLFELKRENAVVINELEEVESHSETFKGVSTKSHIRIKAPSILLKTEDGDGNYREDGYIRLRTPRFTAYGLANDGTMNNSTKMIMKFNKIAIDTSDSIFDTASNKYIYTANGTIKLISKAVKVESVNCERLKGEKKKEKKTVCKGGYFTVEAKNVNFKTLLGEGKNEGEINMNAKTVNVLSYDNEADNKTVKTKKSSITLYSDSINIGNFKTDDDDKKELFAKNINMFGNCIKSRSCDFFANIVDDLTKSDSIGYIRLSSDSGTSILGKKQIKMYIDTTEKAGIESDKVTIWPSLEAKTSITNVPSIKVDNLEVKKHLKTPSTEEGMSMAGPAPSAPKASSSKEKDEIPLVEIETKPLPSRVKANEAIDDCTEKETIHNEKKEDVEKKREIKEQIKAEKEDVEKELKDVKSKISIAETKCDDLDREIKSFEKKAGQGDPKAASTQQDYEAANNKTTELVQLRDTVIPDLKAQEKKLKEKKKKLEKDYKDARSDFHKAEKELKKADDAWNEANKKAVAANKKATEEEEKARQGK